MDIDILFQIAAVGIVVAVLGQILSKSDHAEQGMMVTIAGLVIVLILIINQIGDLFETIRSVFRL